MQTALEIGLALEEAITFHKKGLLLVSLDLFKVFGFIEWRLIDGLAREFGMPDFLNSAFFAFLAGLRKRLKIGDTFFSEWYKTTCGTLQGDAMSILWANLASVVSAKLVLVNKPKIGVRIPA